MKIAVLGDLHLISDKDPHKPLHKIRAFFKNAYPSLQKLIKLINKESPDHIIILGDLVDWISNENAYFALDLLATLNAPWHLTLGNHDIQNPKPDFPLDTYNVQASREKNEQFWITRNIPFGNRVIEINENPDLNLILIDSALSALTPNTETWLNNILNTTSENMPDNPLNTNKINILFTHVPIAIPVVRDYIISVAPRRNLTTYTMSGSPNLYNNCLKNRVHQIYTAHLHFPGQVTQNSTTFNMLPMSISMHDVDNNITSIASATILELNNNQLTTKTIHISH